MKACEILKDSAVTKEGRVQRPLVEVRAWWLVIADGQGSEHSSFRVESSPEPFECGGELLKNPGKEMLTGKRG